MSGDYETLEINQPKISYFKKRPANHSEWFHKLINNKNGILKQLSSNR